METASISIIKPRRSPVEIFLATIALILSAILSLLIFAVLNANSNQGVAQEVKTVSPEEAARSQGYLILHKAENDATGKTVFYEGRNFLDGVGLQLNTKIVTNTAPSSYIVGEFIEWKTADELGEDERILVLKNPLTGEVLPEVLVNVRAVLWGVENLSQPVGGPDTPGEALKIVGRVVYWEKEINEILKKRDAVGVILTLTEAGGQVQSNKQGLLTAGMLTVRRMSHAY